MVLPAPGLPAIATIAGRLVAYDPARHRPVAAPGGAGGGRVLDPTGRVGDDVALVPLDGPPTDPEIRAALDPFFTRHGGVGVSAAVRLTRPTAAAVVFDVLFTGAVDGAARLRYHGGRWIVDRVSDLATGDPRATVGG